MILLCAFLVVAAMNPGPVRCQDEATDEPELEAVQSAELEQLLKEGTDIHEYRGEVTDEVLLANLAAALVSDNSDVCFNAMGYLLSDEAPHDARILPFIQKVGEEMVAAFQLPRYTDECWWRLVRLLGKYPELDSVPILLFAAQHRHYRLGEIDAGEGPVRRRTIDFLDDIAQSLKACTNGAIGGIPEGMRWWNREPREKLLVEWEAWWEKNKPEEGDAGATESTGKAGMEEA